MVYSLPVTGTTITMGGVYRAYYGTSSLSNISLSGTLGSQIGITAGTVTSLSQSFGGRTTPYPYTP